MESKHRRRQVYCYWILAVGSVSFIALLTIMVPYVNIARLDISVSEQRLSDFIPNNEYAVPNIVSSARAHTGDSAGWGGDTDIAYASFSFGCQENNCDLVHSVIGTIVTSRFSTFLYDPYAITEYGFFITDNYVNVQTYLINGKESNDYQKWSDLSITWEDAINIALLEEDQFVQQHHQYSINVSWNGKETFWRVHMSTESDGVILVIDTANGVILERQP